MNSLGSLKNWGLKMTNKSRLEEWKDYISQHAQEVAQSAFNSLCVNPVQSFYLYYRPARDGEFGGVVITGDDKPEGYFLVTSQRISSSWTCMEIKSFILSFVGGLPMLPPP